jgi:hypothetical protein
VLNGYAPARGMPASVTDRGDFRQRALDDTAADPAHASRASAP